MKASQLQQINDANRKCIKVIDSCETLDQLTNAAKYSSIFLQNIVRPRLDEIDLFDKKLKSLINMSVNIENKLLDLIKLKKIQLNGRF